MSDFPTRQEPGSIAPFIAGAEAITGLGKSPRLYLMDGFASPEEIRHIVEVAERALAGNQVAIRRNYTGLSFEMPLSGDQTLEALARRIYETLGMVNDFHGAMRFRRYAPGVHHPPHIDSHRKIRGRMLILTALLYLTDTEEGGETYFPWAEPDPIKIAPRAGRLALWFSHAPNGSKDEASLHESLPVIRGSKATLACFIYKPVEWSRKEIKARIVRRCPPGVTRGANATP